jgi:hypothetical protein
MTVSRSPGSDPYTTLWEVSPRSRTCHVSGSVRSRRRRRPSLLPHTSGHEAQTTFQPSHPGREVVHIHVGNGRRRRRFRDRPSVVRRMWWPALREGLWDAFGWWNVHIYSGDTRTRGAGLGGTLFPRSNEGGREPVFPRDLIELSPRQSRSPYRFDLKIRWL